MTRWWHACLALVSLVSPVSGKKGKLDDILDTVSVGRAGVWGTKDGVIKYMPSAYNDPYNPASPMADVPGQLVQVDVGRDIVYGVNAAGRVYYRLGISDHQKNGTGWRRIDGRLKHVTVSPAGFVWGVNSADNIFHRFMAKNSDPGGFDWIGIGGKLKQISAGFSGVWGVNRHDAIFYRNDTFGDNGSPGTDWTWVEGSLKYIASGDSYVIGVNSEGEIYKRIGITYNNPTGDDWVQLNGPKLEVLDCYGVIVYGLTDKGKLRYFTVSI